MKVTIDSLSKENLSGRHLLERARKASKHRHAPTTPQRAYRCRRPMRPGYVRLSR